MGIKENMLQKLTLVNVAGEKEARLRFSGFKNFLRLSVTIFDNSNPKSKPQYVGHIPINRTGLNLIVEELKRLNEREAGFTFGVVAYKPVWENNKMTNEKVPAGKILVGRKKTDEGIINFIGVIINVEGSEKKFMFKLLPTPYLEILIDGKKADEETASKLWTEAYYKTLDQVLSNLPEVFEDDENNLKETSKSTADKTSNQTEPVKDDLMF